MRKHSIKREDIKCTSTAAPSRTTHQIDNIVQASHMLTIFTFSFVKVINVLCFRGQHMAKERSTLRETSVPIEAATDMSVSPMPTRIRVL